MRPRLISWILVALLAAAAGWFARSVRHEHPAAGSRAGERRILYYQSAMHPWIRSDQPGKCTICGMDLSPVYEGESGIAAGADVINLSSNNVTVANVATSPATRKPLIRTVRVAGTIEDDASRRRVLSAYTDGRLDRLFVTYPGAEVKAGQPLAWLFSPTLLAAVREYVGLVRTGSAASPDSTSMVAAAASRLVQLGLTPEQVTKLPETFSPTNLHVEILAPLTGTVVVKDVLEGQTVAAGQRLFEVADFSTMWFQ
ncbi:MAG TPA: efflux RND transporter periplasmic adaptor subunit, partial [Verrucomicrobiales bacterium]|nr:efflux RND transporter periplasmic adaptor subunit [Verrucomicrobiales bacterium]